jgi:hypothetical protein
VVELLDRNRQRQAEARTSVAAGTQTVTLTLTLNAPLVDGATYRWNIFLTPTGGDHSQALAEYDGLQPVARAIIPAIQMVAVPAVLSSRSNLTVTVQCTAADSAVAVVNLLDNDYNWHGGGAVNVNRGDGLLDVPVVLQAGVPNGNYLFDCFLSDSATFWQNPMARSPSVVTRVAATAEPDFIRVVSLTPTLPAGEVFRFAVSYAAVANRDLHIDLFDARTNFLAGALQAVTSGSGVEEMTISYPSAPPGEYFVTGFITPSGESWTRALAWSANQHLTVVGTNYQRWLESNWGVLLGSDLVHPQEDADGDGASNEAERIAHTAPLDSNDALRLDPSFERGQLVLRWRSALLCRYQLFQRTNVATAWAPVGALRDGTGYTMQAIIKPQLAGPRKFYRLRVTAP